MPNDGESPLARSAVVQSALAGIAGVLMLVGGIPTLIVGIVTGEKETIDIAVLLLAGGFFLALIGAPAAVYFRSHTGRAQRDSEAAPAREDGGGWV